MAQAAGYGFYLVYKYLWGYPGFALQDVYVSFLSCATWEPSTCLHDCRCCLKELCTKKLTLLREIYVCKAFTAGGQAMLREMVLWKCVFEVCIRPGGKEVYDVDWGWKPITKQRKMFQYISFSWLEQKLNILTYYCKQMWYPANCHPIPTQSFILMKEEWAEIISSPCKPACFLWQGERLHFFFQL